MVGKNYSDKTEDGYRQVVRALLHFPVSDVGWRKCLLGHHNIGLLLHEKRMKLHPSGFKRVSLLLIKKDSTNTSDYH